MTAKDKAKDMVKRISTYNPAGMLDDTKILYPSAVQLALIMVDEIMKSIPNSNRLSLSDNSYQKMQYWKEVKQELEKL